MAVVLTALVFRCRSLMTRATVAVLGAIVLLQLLAAGLYVRYSIPLGAIVGLAVAVSLRGWLSRRQAPAVIVVLAALGGLVQTKRCLSLVDYDAKGLVRTALGLEDRRTFLREHLQLYPLYEQVNRSASSDAKVLLSCYCGGFYIDRTTYCGEMIQTSLRFTSWEALTADMSRLGVTHVIAPTVLATGGPDPPISEGSVSAMIRDDEYRVLRPLLSERARAEATAADQGLYEVPVSLAGAR
jgi:hypothetical protein